MALRAAGMGDRPELRCSVLAARTCASGHRPCFRGRAYHTLCIRSFVPHSHIFPDRADNSPHTGPFGAGKNVAQSADMPRPAAAPSRSLLTRPFALGRGRHRASLQASRHASRPLPPFIIYGVECPSPHPPRMLAPSIPRGLRLEKFESDPIVLRESIRI